MIDLDCLKYAELQKLAKAHGLKANQKAAVLKEHLAKILAQDAAAAVDNGAAALPSEAACEAVTGRPASTGSPATCREPPADADRVLPSPRVLNDVDEDKENAAGVDSLRFNHAESLRAACSLPRRQSDAAGVAASASEPGTSVGRRSTGADSCRNRGSQSEMAASVQYPLPVCSPILPVASASVLSEPGTSFVPAADATDVSSQDSSLGLVDDSCLAVADQSRDFGSTPSNSRLLNSSSDAVGRTRNDSTFLVDDDGTESRPRRSTRSCRSDSSRTSRDSAVAEVRCRRSSAFSLSRPSASSPVVDRPTSGVNSHDTSDEAATTGKCRARGSVSSSRSCRSSLQLRSAAAVADSSATTDRPVPLAERLLLLPSDTPSAALGIARSSADGDVLLGSMQQHMSDEELKASLMAALDRQTELRKPEIAERVAKARAQAQAVSTSKDGAASGSSRMRHTPNFASIHAKRFAKMESIQTYVDRKRQKFEDANRLLGLSSPQLLQSKGNNGLASRHGAAVTGSASRSAKVLANSSTFAPAATASVSFAPKMSPRTSAAGSTLASSKSLFSASSVRLQQQESKNPGLCSSSSSSGPAPSVRTGARIVKPIRGGGSIARGATAARAVQRPTAPQARLATASLKPAASVLSQRSAAAILPEIVSPIAAPAQPFNVFAASAGSFSAAAGASSSSSVLNTTFTIERTPTEPKSTAAAKPAAQSSSFAWKPAAASAGAAGYKKPMLKTSQQRRAEALASAKDRRQAAIMHRRLADG